MEKIQKALEKARQQRQQAQPQSHPVRRGRTPQVAKSIPASEGITYRQTRVVAPEGPSLRESWVIAGLTHETLTDAYPVLRTRILQRLTDGAYTALAITSPDTGEGKTLTAVSMAVGLAKDANRTVLLADLDLRRPTIHRYFDLKPEVGLSDCLLGKASLAECLINPGIERLEILPSSPPPRNPSEMLSSPSMVSLARELKTRYPDRIVLYDLPPVLTTDDAIAFLQHIDCCLLVVQEGTPRRGDMQRALDLVNGYHLIGTVLNRSTKRSASYY